MSDGPSTRRRQLGASLRRLREEKGLSLEEAGGAVGLSKATLSRYETKDGSVRWPLIDALCREYGVGDAERAQLVDLAKNARVKGWWQSYTEVIPERMSPLVTFENESVGASHFSVVYIPGLLQTRGYAETLHRTEVGAPPEETIQRSVAARMKRQDILTRADPLRLSVVLDESALRRRVGTPEVHRDQLAHLMDMTDLPNVTVRVLPFDVGPLASTMETFMILSGSDPSMDIVYLESLTVSMYLEKPEEVDKYRQAFADIERNALDESSSLRMMSATRRDVR